MRKTGRSFEKLACEKEKTKSFKRLACAGQEEASRSWLVRKTKSFKRLACEKDRKKLREVGL